MKKISGLALACFACAIAGAQTTSIGVYGGISIPKLASSGDHPFTEDFKSRSAGTVGIFGDFGITPVFSIKGIISYAGEGGKRSGMQPAPASAAPPGIQLPPGTYIYGNFENESILNYLEIPVMAKWEWGNRFRYYVNAGPYVGFLLNATQKVNGNTFFFLDKAGTQPITPVSIAIDAEADVKDDLNTVNFGLTGGGGIKYMLNDVHALLFDVRGAYGLSTLQKDTEANGKSNMGALFFTLGYSFNLHGHSKKAAE